MGVDGGGVNLQVTQGVGHAQASSGGREVPGITFAMYWGSLFHMLELNSHLRICKIHMARDMLA